MEMRRKRAREGTGDADPTDDVKVIAELPGDRNPDTIRRGPRYRQFVAEGWPDLRGGMSQREIAEQFTGGTSTASVSRWIKAFIVDHQDGEGELFEPLEPVSEAVKGDLIAWREEFRPDLQVPDCHVEWSNLLEDTIAESGRTLLLAPQRFGKSEMLIDMCTKLITERPNISIGWVSKTYDLAETMTRFIKGRLEDTDFATKVLGEARSFVPQRNMGMPWTDGKFTVATRTALRKSPTMEALGVGGTVVGRDFDVIVVDDMQDRSRVLSSTRRDKDAEWFFTDLNSRKEEDTALFFICSRQHEDDVPGRIMSDHAEDWRIRVYQAHDPACTKDPREHDEHTHCLLWPEKRTHKWLMAQKRANPDHFKRNYMNDPSEDSVDYLTAADIEGRKSEAFPAGENPGGRLVAGIDPGSAKPTAATLWALKDGKRHLVDAMMAKPGNAGVRQVLSEWRRTYGCSTFVVETNGYQGQIVQDAEVKELIARLKLRVKPHYTSRVNKWDEGAGVVGMLHMIADPEGGVVLPKHGDRRVQERLEQVYRQWLVFDPDMANSKHAQDDLVMASWFPQLEMDRLERSASNKVVYLEGRTSYGTTSYGAMTSYQGVG